MRIPTQYTISSLSSYIDDLGFNPFPIPTTGSTTTENTIFVWIEVESKTQINEFLFGLPIAYTAGFNTYAPIPISGIGNKTLNPAPLGDPPTNRFTGAISVFSQIYFIPENSQKAIPLQQNQYTPDNTKGVLGVLAGYIAEGQAGVMPSTTFPLLDPTIFIST